jgi:hypothetical protein
VASNYPAEGRSASEGGDEPPQLPFRAGGSDQPRHVEARAELRDRETYYAELRLAVHCQNRSQGADPSMPPIPAPQTPLDDWRSDTWARAADQAHAADGVHQASRTENESWDEMVARFGDTWT